MGINSEEGKARKHSCVLPGHVTPSRRGESEFQIDGVKCGPARRACALALQFALEACLGAAHSPAHMKCSAVLAVLTGLLFAATDCRGDDTNAVAATIGTAEAAKWVGKQVVVTGVVAQVSFRPSLVFLNFDKAYPSNRFTAIIRNKNTNEFENLSALRGKTVSVKGQLRDYNGKPEMELTGKSQLKVLSK